MLFWHTKLFLIGLIFFAFLSGLQPTLAIPPVRVSQVFAQAYSQDQTILAIKFSESITLPHSGYVSTHFSSWHPGVDIATGLGIPIRPILKGRVIEVSNGFWGLGHFVTIEHELGFVSTYGHIGKVYVRVGDQVTQNSQIGVVGLTGNTSGPHTHIEITQNGTYINPEKLLPTLSDLIPLTYPTVLAKTVGIKDPAEPQIKEDISLPIADSLRKNSISLGLFGN